MKNEKIREPKIDHTGFQLASLIIAIAMKPAPEVMLLFHIPVVPNVKKLPANPPKSPEIIMQIHLVRETLTPSKFVPHGFSPTAFTFNPKDVLFRTYKEMMARAIAP